MQIHIIPILQDNYVFLVVSADKQSCFIVDPGEGAPVLSYLRAHKLTPQGILLTHHHDDHIGGVADLVKVYGCDVYGFQDDHYRLPPLSHPLNHGEVTTIMGYKCRIHHVPGHTRGHIAYDFFEDHVCFVGDTLFSMGCGRVFEGTYEQMHKSLEVFRHMDHRTKIYCAHEYTQSNMAYVKSVYDSPALSLYDAKITALRANDQPTIPFILGDEVTLNPFLAVSDEAFRTSIGLGGLTAEQAFAKLRADKDLF